MVELKPTAMQSVVDTHEIPVVSNPESTKFQVDPPSSLLRIPGSPPAKQTESVGQLTAERPRTPDGMSASIQVDPPSSDVAIDGISFSLSPTATQVVELDAFGAHETARKLASGGNEAVVCH
jgi:hypothetical protein